MKKNKFFIFFIIISATLLFSLTFVPGCFNKSTVTVEGNKIIESEISGLSYGKVSEDKQIIENGKTITQNLQEEDADEYEREGQFEKAPTIALIIYEGPLYSSEDNVCYYRIEAIVTGYPEPVIKFSRDDSNGNLGENRAQVNLYDTISTYKLTATATNSEGSSTSSIELDWGCELTQSDTFLTYSREEVDYFFEIALGVEYGSADPLLHKWVDDVKIKINGEPAEADLETLGEVIRDLENMSGISFSIVKDKQNVEIYFVKIEQFSSIVTGYVEGNMGFFRVWWDNDGNIYKSTILIASEGLSQQERSHLIREELTQSMGLMNDSWQYPDSIFYQGWTSTTSYAPIDISLIKLLYAPQLESKMGEGEIKDIIKIK